jgi:hypothetical protein
VGILRRGIGAEREREEERRKEEKKIEREPCD